MINLKFNGPGPQVGIAAAIGLLIAIAALMFLITFGLSWVIFWCFGVAHLWTWKIGLGLALIAFVLRLIFSPSGSN